MADADNKNDTPDTGQLDLKSEIDAKLSDVSRKLADMQSQWQSSMQTVADSIIASRAPAPTTKPTESFFEDDGITIDPAKVEARASAAAARTAQELISRERKRDEVLASYAAQYPEMGQAGSEFNQAILEAHKGLPQNLKDTPEGYEMAILRAAAKQGVVPRSKRTSSDDFTLSSRGGNRPPKKDDVEVSEATQIFSEFINKAAGRDPNSKEVQEGLKSALKRNDYHRYR